ncbi:MAG: class I poly(R)-hydroxyalkanoic acid synthase [Alphaproteobacteria bacterium]|nr:MAG: class I poly(R)-hydroxyalkanoic acid synthase [Alphaproteobacteria bacterium]
MSDATPAPLDPERIARINANVAKLEELSQRLVAALARRKPHHPGLDAPGPELYAKAATALMAEMMTNPARIIEQQVSYWTRTLQNLIEVQQALAAGDLSALEKEPPPDKRFANPLWRTHPWFHFLMHQYLLNADAIRRAVDQLEGLDEKERKRVAFFAEQLAELISPTNFLATNPEALQRAIETDGESLVAGLENLVRDLERNDGELLVTLADPDAFKVGENLATTPGGVVYRNRMFELIQYAPSTDKVHRIPLLIFPPWINKFYILDLNEKKSLVRWLVDRGFTVFMVSWVNPDASYADVGLDTYIEEGYREAITQVCAITGEEKINVTGYCIGGTTLAATLAYMAAIDDNRVRSATFFTTLTDFTDAGEVGVFLSEDFISAIEAEVEAKGYLSSFFLKRTFSYLRPSDLVYQPAVRSYLLGEKPPAFDLLYWNGDSTNLPARMAVEYLRRWCQGNELARGTWTINGVQVNLKDVRVPSMAIACETDHIAPWRSSYRGLRLLGRRPEFVLTQSGHIAGIVNPPTKRKYDHFTNPDWPADPEDWLSAAERHEGSWWPRWGGWLARRSGAKIPARTRLGDDAHPVLCPAPGTYVLARSDE